jgi:predicted Zn-ribbon and HTH transcriptional regulator
MQGTRRLQIRRSSIDVETVAKSNNTSHMFYEDMLSHREGIRGAPIMEVLRNNVKRKNVESFLHEVIEEVATHGNDHIENPIQNNASGRESNVQEKDVTDITVVNISSVQGPKRQIVLWALQSWEARLERTKNEYSPLVHSHMWRKVITPPTACTKCGYRNSQRVTSMLWIANDGTCLMEHIFEGSNFQSCWNNRALK